jgi:hypothetical protein
MNPMKRLGLAALLAVGVTLLASTPAQAKAPKGEDWGTILLTNVGVQPLASGEATLTDVTYGPQGRIAAPLYSGTLTVKCRNLTPGATYLTQAGTLRASRKVAGEWEVTGKVQFFPDFVSESTIRFRVLVVRLNADGSGTWVLTGDFLRVVLEQP